MVAPRENARSRTEPRPPDPPRADMVAGCPPHHWVIVAGWQQCKKCDLRQEVPTPESQRYAYPRRDPNAPKPGAPRAPEVRPAAEEE